VKHGGQWQVCSLVAVYEDVIALLLDDDHDAVKARLILAVRDAETGKIREREYREVKSGRQWRGP
jgi:hypothetical protein